jgi:transcription antitermination factor NusG
MKITNVENKKKEENVRLEIFYETTKTNLKLNWIRKMEKNNK